MQGKIPSNESEMAKPPDFNKDKYCLAMPRLPYLVYLLIQFSFLTLPTYLQRTQTEFDSGHNKNLSGWV